MPGKCNFIGSEKMIHNVLFIGVGGEGVLSASVVLARAANLDGFEVRGTQLHGLAQRGGSVPIHLRFGNKVHSPTIPRAQADLIIGLEPIEALRACYFAERKRTNFVVDAFPIVPIYARLNKQEYPEMKGIGKMLKPFAKKIIMADASDICEKELGNPVYGNIVMLGIALSGKMLPISRKSIIAALKETFPKDYENNIKALEMGLEWEK